MSITDILRRTAAILALCAVAACAAPGAPVMMNGTVGGIGPLPACRNVAPDMPVASFITDFYLTTAGSAISEGARAGLTEGVSDDDSGVGRQLFGWMLKTPQRLAGVQVVPKGAPPDPFCMTINAPEDAVTRALASVMGELRARGYPVRRTGPDFEAGPRRLGHRAAQWVDRYSVFTVPIGAGQTGVYVQRQVFISRQGSDYIEGTSVGGNEAYILARARQLATGR